MMWWKKRLIWFIDEQSNSYLGAYVNGSISPSRVESVGINIATIKSQYDEVKMLYPNVTMTLMEFMASVILQECFHEDMKGDNDFEESQSDLVSLKSNPEFVYCRLRKILFLLYQNKIVNKESDGDLITNYNLYNQISPSHWYNIMFAKYTQAVLNLIKSSDSYKQSLESAFEQFKSYWLYVGSWEWSVYAEKDNWEYTWTAPRKLGDFKDCFSWINSQFCKDLAEEYEKIILGWLK